MAEANDSTRNNVLSQRRNERDLPPLAERIREGRDEKETRATTQRSTEGTDLAKNPQKRIITDATTRTNSLPPEKIRGRQRRTRVSTKGTTETLRRTSTSKPRTRNITRGTTQP